MNRPLLVLASAAACVAVAGPLAARAVAGAEAAAPRAEVIFDHPENFTDVKDKYDATVAGRDAILAAIREFIVDQARSCVPAGDKLTITFTDIDLAGDFEPWRGPDFDRIRIVRDIYPPAFKFTYRVTDAAGRVVKAGRENIRDLDFQMRLTLNQEDPLRYEKDILGDWMQRTGSELKKR